MEQRSILISGASVAGPALAYWLHRHGGFRVTVVEHGRGPAEGSYKVDLRGPAIDLVRRMGVHDVLRESAADLRGVTVLDERGRVLTTIDRGWGFVEEGELQIRRGDLARALYEVTRNDTDYVFGDAIASISQQADGVTVTFEHGEPHKFDLVIGADGVHSNVRSLAFGAELDFLRHLGFHAAGFSLPNFLELDRWGYLYAPPNRLVHVYSTCGGAEAHVDFVFEVGEELRTSPVLRGAEDVLVQKELVASLFADRQWEMGRILDAMIDAEDFHFDAVSWVEVDGWARQRVALVGDAAWGPSFASGQGTSQALVGAYVLAGELASAGADHHSAFHRYEAAMAPWIATNRDTGHEVVRHMLGVSPTHHWWHMQFLKLLPWLPFAKPFARHLQRAGRSEPRIRLADYGI